MGRIACAFVPRFELALQARAEPALWKRPVAVVDLSETGQRIRSCSPAAERLGVLPGQRVAHARGLCPEMEILSPDPADAQKAQKEVLTALSALSPMLDVDGRGAFFLSLEGLHRLVKEERRFAQDVSGALARLGLHANVAVADGPFVGWVMASRKEGITCVPSGAEAQHLSRIPVSQLGLSERAMELLTLFGVRTAGALMQLPAGTLARRLGAEGAQIERLCRGQVLTALPSESKVPRPTEEAALELDVPTDELEPLLFLLKSLLDRLLGSLAYARTALTELTVVMRLDTRAELTHAITPAEPTLDVRALMDLVRLWLESKPFPAPVTAVTLRATRSGAATPRQLSLFQQREQEERAALERAVARLASAFGAEAVVRPSLADTHRPEARLKWVPFVQGRPHPGAHPHPGPLPPAGE
ncbi:MAG TPA: DNA polymerase Y family protein, partial [Myxococcaceae bacterium]|nr:DNA polymerase Y family protein [Myxococcaceae bacterium]